MPTHHRRQSNNALPPFLKGETMVFKTREHQDPNTVIIDRITRKVRGRFKDGLFETNDPKLINRLMPHYETVTKQRRASKCQQTKTGE